MIRKISVILAIVLALLAVSPVSFAATPLWKQAGEKIAPMEKEHDYYDTWDPSLKAELVRILYEAGELRDDEDAARLVKGGEMPDGEKGALCDRVVLRYLDVTRDDLVSLDSLLGELRGVYGGTPAWSVEDKYWYNELLRKNGMLSSSEDPDYILPEDGDISQEEAVRIARDLLESKADWDLDSGVLTEEEAVRLLLSFYRLMQDTDSRDGRIVMGGLGRRNVPARRRNGDDPEPRWDMDVGRTG